MNDIAILPRHLEQFQQNCVAVLRPELRKNKGIDRFCDSEKSRNDLCAAQQRKSSAIGFHLRASLYFRSGSMIGFRIPPSKPITLPRLRRQPNILDPQATRNKAATLAHVEAGLQAQARRITIPCRFKQYNILFAQFMNLILKFLISINNPQQQYAKIFL